ncbi:hypothetical protein TSH100_07055 [Azospirillum sp. TSH100]|uniref:DUF6691 family protein n=1 Tax=Azospirillum sp. TSH100 TaxID=652764 RepID=UPI000D61A355|nr:DUF6691 family protein [Azospirillum sp. TSH100]PWC88671.1 hypothetical protein TSH100_07055 [Azospirillum sp. TSH100]QCG86980.1 hypothetical protein E6C72_04055 [Azospirillum sp. TSH100]
MRSLTAGLFGFVFGLGLIVAGMTDPARVLGFLDVADIWTGSWDPTLAFVMIGAIAGAAPAFAIARRKPVSVLGDPISLPDRRLIDARLVGGAALFGLGWGLAGICPGPALVLVGNDGLSALLFVASLLAGGWVADVLPPILRRSRTGTRRTA